MKCKGCHREELHKMCPAHGTPFYMSKVPFTSLLEDFCKTLSSAKVNQLYYVILDILEDMKVIHDRR